MTRAQAERVSKAAARPRRLKTIAAWINENLPELRATIERGRRRTFAA